MSNITRQGIKYIRNIVTQSKAGYINFTHWEWAHLNGDNGTPQIVFSVGVRADYNQTYIECIGNVLQFLTTSNIRNLAAPIDDTDAVNKAYVDAIKAEIKTMVANASDFAAFKAAIAGW